MCPNVANQSLQGRYMEHDSDMMRPSTHDEGLARMALEERELGSKRASLAGGWWSYADETSGQDGHPISSNFARSEQ